MEPDSATNTLLLIYITAAFALDAMQQHFAGPLPKLHHLIRQLSNASWGAIAAAGTSKILHVGLLPPSKLLDATAAAAAAGQTSTLPRSTAGLLQATAGCHAAAPAARTNYPW
jgi:hypothetical protein